LGALYRFIRGLHGGMVVGHELFSPVLIEEHGRGEYPGVA
jgi:hypothetical protein